MTQCPSLAERLNERAIKTTDNADFLPLLDASEAIQAQDKRIAKLVDALETIRLASCDYTTGTRARMQAIHKIATAALSAKENPQ